MSKKSTLLLNADYAPEKIISWQKAMIQDVIKTKNSAYTVEYYNTWMILDSSNTKHPLPAVMALRKYVQIGSRPCPYTKSNVYARDMMICQYCEQKFSRSDLTVDHVIPSSRWRRMGKSGTSSVFTNVVTCCKRCNSVKGDRTPEEANMYLLKRPCAVTRREVFRNKVVLMPNIPDEWKPYLSGILSES